ncbi:MAG: hypothetical protein U5K76_06190 [Woeseiaceae bacterium]|nr:hypothetical protein [Woeseiaceae bacterium]
MHACARRRAGVEGESQPCVPKTTIRGLIMNNPFRKVASALLLRGALFCILGLLLLARTVPSLLDVDRTLNLPGALIGAFLLSFGVFDVVRGLQRLMRIRAEKLDTMPIDFAYVAGHGGEAIPPRLMSADENPNEDGQATLIEWLARVFPRLAYLPHPYTGTLHSVLVAFGLGVAGLVIYVLLRVLMAGQPQLGSILDWYLWLYFLIGFGFWAAVGQFGFRRAIRFESNLMPGKLVTLFLVLLVAAIALAIGQARVGTEVSAPPDLGALPAILCAGALLVMSAVAVIVYLRGQRTPDEYAVHRSEEFFTVGMHPTDMINVIKSATGKLGGGAYMHLGSWKPTFKEHTAVNAGEFEADLNAESCIKLNDRPSGGVVSLLGTGLAWAGIIVVALAGVLLWGTAGDGWNTTLAGVMSLRVPIALSIFGTLLYRLGIIPVAELEWTSVLTSCRIEGTFQTQGGMALMNAGGNLLKGSVLTSATVQPRCAYLTSVGYLQPGLARNRVVRLIDRVEPAPHVANDLLAAIRTQASQMLLAGASSAPDAGSMPELPDPAAAADGPPATDGNEPAH